MTEFFRFPHTPHLTWLGKEQPRTDKTLSPEERIFMLENELVVEEKIDGANIGFSLTPNGDIQIQNRGQYLSPPFMGQFSKLSDWLLSNEGTLFDGLESNLIVLENGAPRVIPCNTQLCQIGGYYLMCMISRLVVSSVLRDVINGGKGLKYQ